MKKMRKIIPALAMLLVSAVLMSTASFAWFSSNSTATAKDITVNVQAARNISIAKGANVTTTTSYNSYQELGVKGDKMIPGSTIASTTPEFYYVSKAGGITTGSYAPAGDTEFAQAAAAANKLGKGGDEVVYIKDTISLMASGAYEGGAENHGDILASVNIVNSVSTDITNSPVAMSLRVMLVVAKGGEDPSKAVIFAPVTGATASYKAIVAEGQYSEDSLSDETVTPVTAGTSSSVIEDIKSDEVYTVDIYVWFEGQDQNCTAANAINLKDIKLEVAFTFEGVTA